MAERFVVLRGCASITPTFDVSKCFVSLSTFCCDTGVDTNENTLNSLLITAHKLDLRKNEFKLKILYL
jgi:hypothetical protein